MQTMKNILLALVSTVVLCCTVVFVVLDGVGVDLPVWLKVGQTRSTLEGRVYEEAPELTVEALTDGRFQQSFEAYLSDRVPLRDDLLLMNAAAQRIGIGQAAFLYGYDLSPTFFGSGYVYSASKNRVYGVPTKERENTQGNFAVSARMLDALAQAHQDSPVYFFFVQNSLTLSQGELEGLVSGELTYDYVNSNFFEKLNDVTVVANPVTSLEEYDQSFYATDHHWNMDGAYDAYLAIMEAMGLGNSVVEKGEKAEYDVAFYGSYARAGLVAGDCVDTIFDYDFGMGGLTATVNGNEEVVLPIGKRKYDRGVWYAEPFSNRYGEYFHMDYGTVAIENPDASTDESILIVGDSYSNSMERLFAAHFRNVYAYDTRLADMTVSEYLEEVGGVNRIVFVMSYGHVVDSNFYRMVK